MPDSVVDEAHEPSLQGKQGILVFEDIFDPGLIASHEEIMDFLELWLTLFVIVFVLRILQRIKNRLRRARLKRHQRRLAKRGVT